MAARSKLTMKIQVLADLSITTWNQAHACILQFLPPCRLYWLDRHPCRCLLIAQSISLPFGHRKRRRPA